MKMEISKEFRFEASHVLSRHPGKCSRLHGHSWKLTVYAENEVHSETGFVMDYADLSDAVKPIVEMLDHRHLGEWIGFARSPQVWHVPSLGGHFYPTSENLLRWIGYKLVPRLNWSKLELAETCTSNCVLRREDYERGI